MSNSKKPAQSIVRHHYIRTFFAAIFGIIALVLIFASILVVWANRTLTDTPTYVAAVAPLVKQAAIQDFVAQKASDKLLQEAPTEDLAQNLLPAEQVTGKTHDQLVEALRTVLHDSVVQILSSAGFAQLWKDTNQTAHAQLVSQLEANAPEITLDLGPLVTEATKELKQTKLAPIGDKIKLAPDSAKLNFKGSMIEKVHKYYTWFKTGTIAIVVTTLVAIGLCVWISVHHAKTLRRILVGTGVIALTVAGLVKLPSVISIHTSDPAAGKAIVAIASTVTHNLQVACLIIGAVCLTVAVGSKIYGRLSRKPA